MSNPTSPGLLATPGSRSQSPILISPFSDPRSARSPSSSFTPVRSFSSVSFRASISAKLSEFLGDYSKLRSKQVEFENEGKTNHLLNSGILRQQRVRALLASRVEQWDDNEFEQVNIVRPDDFYQSRDADAGNW